MKSIRWILCVLLGAALVCMLAASGCEEFAAAVGEAPSAGAAPEEGETPDGDVLTFSAVDQYGAVVDTALLAEYDLTVVNYWAYWCGPCLDEMPSFETLHGEYPNVLFLGVSTDNAMPAMTEAAMLATGITYSVIPPEGDIAELAAAMKVIPVTALYGRDGRQIGEEIVGSQTYEFWKQLIEANLPAGETVPA